ncbi:hypothetical protein W97_05106 [Coniosporium apollinis CBS 100218]|uniref:Uncharacterized protein n=1 Tax=Coniosporium apollinis (strain CBS 100218) TaxID=1168221 RepID=R7YVM4_CONA1|nr:uncharacterized protein W97_05106 [Coniosporium apollinis CBS 100218]EON65864.1 hypothetical protein W97_05106 [Coniosporium apollinis CBS 100218]
MSSLSHIALLPPPQGAQFPVPDLSPSFSPSRSSAPNKRRRTESFSSSILSSTSGFSANFKKDMLRSGPNCWHCGASPVGACYVVGRKDRSFERLKRQGLITFDDLGDVDNGIHLSLCHVNCADVNSPSFTFFPSDLHFFIDFETQHYQRREREARVDRPPSQALSDRAGIQGSPSRHGGYG